jgi:hypothetical protein
MPFKPWFRNISPLAWCLSASAVASVVTMVAILYLAFFYSPNVYVRGGYVSASVDGSVDIKDQPPVRVQIIGR